MKYDSYSYTRFYNDSESSNNLAQIKYAYEKIYKLYN